ncbi:TetR/AcrR family transcriptional regulator [Sutterella sp.]|uniref:TetR/AcrR family transcriptional regulator n=1 Tax=Sutterella sp. TaxID=1981025 RepID=UPI0026DF1F17|nr:TetR/AcrR family transcriptional regulator [Sutterella sp.]MDO5532113.1 TetR/AcrR family transcriptional regulator [Sutterella sp.]
MTADQGNMTVRKVTGSADRKPMKPRTRLSPEDRREQILDAAIVCFLREGRFNVPLNEIAREADVSRNLVYHYFHNQDALLEAIVDRGCTRFHAMMEAVPDTTPEETMHALALCFVRYNAENAEGVRLAFSIPKVSTRIAPHVSAMHELIAGRFARAMGLPCEGTVRTALLSASEFMTNFVRGAGERLSLSEEAAAAMIVEVAKTAAEGAVRFDREVSGS